MTDPISDMLTRIRNAAGVNSREVNLPYSKIKEDVAKILVTSGYLKSANRAQAGGRLQLSLEIADEDRPSSITSIKRLSRPGRRLYVGSKEIPAVKRGRGIVIISTSKGIMTGDEAAKKRLGGELICEVY
ncbi:30S ribosomal protein S8 [Candidatus Saccharibacteria bacterium]|nr:30S ribosomal protein S8 [Candidatus Saccharibacteria bacterium]